MNIFIDTSIYLDYFLYTEEKKANIEVLADAVEQGTFTLLVTDQVEKEFWKNREGKIASALKEFHSFKFKNAAPMIVREHDKFNDYQTQLHKAEELHREIHADLCRAAVEEQTSVDVLIRRIFAKANKIEANEQDVECARRRMLRGIPPGKQNSMGDQLNWECLLTHAPSGDIRIVSKDGDYAAEANKDTLKSYLRNEWEKKKSGKAILYTRFSQLLASEFPAASTAIDMEKELCARTLLGSWSFACTHEAIKELSKYTSFTGSTARLIAKAFLNNGQVKAISSDQDLASFLTIFLREHRTLLGQDLIRDLEALLP